MTVRSFLPGALLLLLAACATPLPSPPSPPGKPPANPDALWGIIQRDCSAEGPPRGACLDVDRAPQRRDVLLKDSHGHYQYLVLPLDRISGIESPALLRADAPNYFAAAWAARRHTEQALGQPLPRAVASLALNSPHGRSQHQLHIHVDCLRADVLAQLQRMQPGIGAQWAVLPEPLRGHAYQARWLGGTALTANPIRLLADDLAAPGDMASWSLLVSGQPAADGAPGFLLLATRRDTEQGNNASAEELQDHACVAVTGAGGPLDGVR